MRPRIDRQTGLDMLRFLSGEYVIPLCDGQAWLYCTRLPGDTVSAAAETPDGVLHLFVDLAKPDNYAHAREMLREWLGLDCSKADIRESIMAQFV